MAPIKKALRKSNYLLKYNLIKYQYVVTLAKLFVPWTYFKLAHAQDLRLENEFPSKRESVSLIDVMALWSKVR